MRLPLSVIAEFDDAPQSGIRQVKLNDVEIARAFKALSLFVAVFADFSKPKEMDGNKMPGQVWTLEEWGKIKRDIEALTGNIEKAILATRNG